MFESIGVGDENATAYGATLTWLIKGSMKIIKMSNSSPAVLSSKCWIQVFFKI